MRITVIVAALTVAACSSTSPAPATGNDNSSTVAEAPVQRTEAASASNAPVIATIATNHQRVSILGGAKDGEPLRVVLRDAEGTILADNITVDELTKRDPVLGALVTTAIASNSGPSNAFLWGGL
jgi:hypothetical protein